MGQLFIGTGKQFHELKAVTLDAEGYRDVERRIKFQPQFLGEPLVVIAEDEDFAQLAGRNINIIALDSMGRIVVIEMITEAGSGGSDLHALQYVSHLAMMRPEDLGKIAFNFASRPHNERLMQRWADMGVEIAGETVELASLLGATFHRDADDYATVINQEQRVIFAAERFESSLVNVIDWLVRAGADVRGLKYSKFVVSGQELYFAEQVVPSVSPAVDQPSGGPLPQEVVEPWRSRGRSYHVERINPRLVVQLDRLLLLVRNTTFAIDWGYKYYFWIRGHRRNFRVRTYFRNHLDIGFFNASPEGVSEFLSRYGLGAIEPTMVGGYAGSPFVTVSADTKLDGRWEAALNDWLSGTEEYLSRLSATEREQLT